MTHLRMGLIAAALLSATHSSGLAAEPLEGVYAAVLTSGWEITEPAGPNRIQGKAPDFRFGLTDAVLALRAAQPARRTEFGMVLGNDALVNGFKDWYGVYSQNLDRVAERYTLYGMLRETPRLGFNDNSAPTAFCCQRGNAPTSLEHFASTMTAREVLPTFFLFGMLRKKGWNYNFDEGWRAQAGVRHMQYGNSPKSKVGFLTVERYWESFRASYSYQVERSSGNLAPSQVLQFDYVYGLRDSIGVSFAYGREMADFGALGVLNTETRNVALRGQHWFKQGWALTFQAGYNDHGDLPAQKGVRMGVRHSF